MIRSLVLLWGFPNQLSSDSWAVGFEEADPCSALDCETTNGIGSKIFCPGEKVMWAAIPGRGALRARRGGPTPAFFRIARPGAARPASAHHDEHALGLPRPSAKRQAAVQGAAAHR